MTILPSIIPQLIKIPSIYEFWVEFLPALCKQKSALSSGTEASASSGTSEGSQGTFDEVFQRCLNAAVRQWDSLVAQPRSSYPYYGYQHTAPSPKIPRIVQLTELCISTQHLKTVESLFALVLQSQGDLPTKMKTLYSPLIQELLQMLAKKGTDISSYPFGEFFRLIIGYYLQGILGAKPRNIRVPILRKIGCGCVDCNSIDNFLFSENGQQTFRYVQQRRTHMEGYLRRAPDLVTFSTIRTGSPHGLHVTKSQDIQAATQWQIRQREAKTFLGQFGGDSVIARIMGTRHADVAKALDGTQQFRLASANAAPQPRLSVSTPSTASTSAPLPVAAAAPQQSTIVGQKRKKTPQVHGDVIDLTENSP